MKHARTGAFVLRPRDARDVLTFCLAALAISSRRLSGVACAPFASRLQSEVPPEPPADLDWRGSFAPLARHPMCGRADG